MEIKIFIVTAVHNSIDQIRKFIECVRHQDFKNTKFVIVDDGSTDNTSNYIHENHPEIILLHGNGKLWWGGSLRFAINNILSLATDNDYVLTINDDCEITPDYLNKILQVAISHPRSIVGSWTIDIRDKSTIIDGPTKLHWPKSTLTSIYSGKQINDLPNNEMFRSDTLTTRGTLYPIKLFKDIDNFDNINFPHHLADIDLSLRAKYFGYSLIIPRNLYVYNDSLRTGISLPIDFSKTPQKFSTCMRVVFSRISSSNIFDQLNFIRLHSPKNYKLSNYKRLVRNYCEILSSFEPLYSLKKLTRNYLK